jgi:hypothetical protein
MVVFYFVAKVINIILFRMCFLLFFISPIGFESFIWHCNGKSVILQRDRIEKTY